MKKPDDLSTTIYALRDEIFRYADRSDDPVAASATIMTIATNLSGELLAAVAARSSDPAGMIRAAVPEFARQVQGRAELVLPLHRWAVELAEPDRLQ